jgi:hypothetical protein
MELVIAAGGAALNQQKTALFMARNLSIKR